MSVYPPPADAMLASTGGDERVPGHARRARPAADRTRGTGSPSSRVNASSDASDVGLRAAITFAAISRTRQCSSEHAATTAGSACGSQTYRTRAGPGPRPVGRRGLPQRPASTPGAESPPRTHSSSASVRVPSAHVRHLQNELHRAVALDSHGHPRRRGVDCWTMTPASATPPRAAPFARPCGARSAT